GQAVLFLRQLVVLFLEIGFLKREVFLVQRQRVLAFHETLAVEEERIFGVDTVVGTGESHGLEDGESRRARVDETEHVEQEQTRAGQDDDEEEESEYPCDYVGTSSSFRQAPPPRRPFCV